MKYLLLCILLSISSLGLKAQEWKIPGTFLSTEIIRQIRSGTVKGLDQAWADPSFDRNKGFSNFQAHDDWYRGADDLNRTLRPALLNSEGFRPDSPYRVDVLVVEISEANATRTLGKLTIVGKMTEQETGKIVMAFKHYVTLFYSPLSETRAQSSSASHYTGAIKSAVMEGYTRLAKQVSEGLYMVELKKVSVEAFMEMLDALPAKMLAANKVLLNEWSEKKKALGFTDEIVPKDMRWRIDLGQCVEDSNKYEKFIKEAKDYYKANKDTRVFTALLNWSKSQVEYDRQPNYSPSMAQTAPEGTPLREFLKFCDKQSKVHEELDLEVMRQAKYLTTK